MTVQKYTSAATSINSSKVPAVFKKVKTWGKGCVNLDLGGGKYDTATEYLKQFGTINAIYDPYNRTQVENALATVYMCRSACSSCTISNVLNVIAEPEAREAVLRQAYDALCEYGLCYITVYEGNGTGVGAESSKGWQENRKLRTYLQEVKQVFENADVRNGMIIARKGQIGW